MNDVQLYKKFQQNPLLFVQYAWDLIPQKIKPEFKNDVEIFAANGQWDKITVQHFENFEKGNLTWQQWVLFKAVERGLIGKGSNKISVVSGHGIGKSSSLSMLIIWYLFCFKNSQIGATAPTADQLHSVLWKELKIWLDKMPPKERDYYEWQADSLNMKESPQTWSARARTARKENTEALAGLHGEYVFLCIDEASGVDDAIYKSAEGSLTGPNTLVVLISNGTRNLGYFYDTHNNDKNYWQTLSFNSENSPIVEKDYVTRMEQKYGRDSDEFRIRVKGKFPTSEQMDEQGWIPLITDRDIRQVSDGIPFVGKAWLGIDPSGEGDDTTRWVLRDRFQARVVATEMTSNPKSIAKKTHDLMKEMDIQPENVIIDNFGVGANVASELLLLDHILHVIALNWADKAHDDEVYLNKRAEAHFRGRAWMLRGGSLVGDELKRDIIAVAYKNMLNGKKQIIDKPNLKKRLGRSPDRGDAFFLTFVEDSGMDVYDNAMNVQKSVTQNDIYSAI